MVMIGLLLVLEAVFGYEEGTWLMVTDGFVTCAV
jgi:hypothetical protein